MTGKGRPIEKVTLTNMPGHDLFRQELGCCAQAMAVEFDGEILPLNEFIAEITDRLYVMASKLDIGDIQAEKFLKWIAQGPSGSSAGGKSVKF